MPPTDFSEISKVTLQNSEKSLCQIWQSHFGNISEVINMSEVWKMDKSTVKRYIKADSGRLSAVLEYTSGARVAIPINHDGSVRWFDDNKLVKNK